VATYLSLCCPVASSEPAQTCRFATDLKNGLSGLLNQGSNKIGVAAAKWRV
jgi:hypothetical protein